MFPMEILNLAEKLVADCTEKNIKIATAESCTGGLIAGCLTAVGGSSAVFERGFTTYSNAAKSELLGVPEDMIEAHGAVSEQVAAAMAEGALAAAPVQLSIAVTGIAGPTGGTTDKPIGTVQIASACAGKKTINKVFLFDGDRNEVRLAAVKASLEMMDQQIN